MQIAFCHVSRIFAQPNQMQHRSKNTKQNNPVCKQGFTIDKYYRVQYKHTSADCFVLEKETLQ